MEILFLGNSSIFQRKIYFSLKKIKKLKIQVATHGKFNEKKKNIIYYNSYKKAVDQTKAKLIYISLVNADHYKWAIYCLNKNKHIIIDKPFALNFNQTNSILKLAKKKNLFVSEAIVFQKHKRFIKLLSLINFKKKIVLKSNFHIPRLEKKNFRNFKIYGGGCFQDMSPYASYLVSIFFKNQKYKIKKITNENDFDNFTINVSNKNTNMICSFKFNSSYKNEINIENNLKIFNINYAFSPPIDKKVNLDIFDDFKKKEYKLIFKKENTFDSYFFKVFKILKKKKYNYFYNEIKKRAKIKKKIT